MSVSLSATELFSRLTAGNLTGWGAILIILVLSLIQISPVRFRPWNAIFSWIGRKMHGEQLEKLESQLEGLQSQVTTMWVNAHRQTILVFARECRAGLTHSPDEWANVLTVADEYEVYVEKHNIANGVVKADSRYIRDLYHQLSHEQKL